MKACLRAPGVVAHPRNSYGYCSGSRLARATNSALSFWLANYEADHWFGLPIWQDGELLKINDLGSGGV
jgi:hypothetical protein